MTAAGPLMNFVLALVLAVVLMAAIGEYAVVNRIDVVTDGTPAQEAGIEVGDKIVGVNGQSFTAAEDVSNAISQTGDADVVLTIERGGETFDVTVGKEYDEASSRYLMGITFAPSACARAFGARSATPPRTAGRCSSSWCRRSRRCSPARTCWIRWPGPWARSPS